MREKVRTKGDLSVTSEFHQEAIRQGEAYFKPKSQNVIDKYKGKSDEEIKTILQQTANPFAVCFEHWIGDFNLSAGVRNANGFNARKVFYLGDKKWDRRGAVGTHNYTDVEWLATIEDFMRLQDEYTIVGIDNVPGAVPLSSYQFVENTLFVFGEEGVGLTPAMQSMCKNIVEIPMYGSVRSFNCGVASGIIMHEFVSRFKKV